MKRLRIQMRKPIKFPTAPGAWCCQNAANLLFFFVCGKRLPCSPIFVKKSLCPVPKFGCLWTAKWFKITKLWAEKQLDCRLSHKVDNPRITDINCSLDVIIHEIDENFVLWYWKDPFVLNWLKLKQKQKQKPNNNNLWADSWNVFQFWALRTIIC